MDPLQNFEKRLLSGSLIDPSKIKANRPPWLCAQHVPKLYRNLEAMVTLPTSSGNASGSAVSSLNTGLVYQLLLSSGLPQSILAALWDQCSRSSPGVLLQHEFYQALALVAICQKGYPPNPALLLSLPEAPLPHLPLLGCPRLDSGSAQLPPSTPMAPSLSPIMTSIQTPSATILVEQTPSTIFSLCDQQRSQQETDEFLKPQNPPILSGTTLTDMFSIQNNQCEQTALSGKNAVVDDDDFADFQSAPVCKSNNSFASVVTGCSHDGLSAKSDVGTSLQSAPLSNGDLAVNTPESGLHINPSSSTYSANNGIAMTGEVDESRENRHENRCVFSSFINSSSNSSIPEPKSSSSRNSSGPFVPIPATIVPSVLPPLFGSITVQMTETVQPPTEPHPWLNYSLKSQDSNSNSAKMQSDHSNRNNNKKKSTRRPTSIDSDVKPAAVASAVEDQIKFESTKPTVIDDDFDEFADFQSAPSGSGDPKKSSIEHHDAGWWCSTTMPGNTKTSDKYSVFRTLKESTDQASEPIEAMAEQHRENVNEFKTHKESIMVATSESSLVKNISEAKVDILALMKLPSIPTLNLDDDLDILDSLKISPNTSSKAGSALEELQQLDLCGLISTKDLASGVASLTVSPAKSAGSGGSIGEARDSNDRNLALFGNRRDYSECTSSLSSFELGPNSESNSSSPTKGSILSLELNSPKRTPPEDEAALEWSVDGPTSERIKAVTEEEAEPEAVISKSPEEFCWAQPPMFPPPDPTTESGKPTSAVQELAELSMSSNSYADTKAHDDRTSLTREQVAESWTRILSKITAIFETASHILGDDRIVLAEVLDTTKGRGYVSSLLEVYNVNLQLRKAAELFNVEGLAKSFEQVETAWRRRLDDVAVMLGLSVICLDHMCSPSQSSDSCAICLLPLSLRPRLLFGDNVYHSTCANFWANVLAEGLPCLKLN